MLSLDATVGTDETVFVVVANAIVGAKVTTIAAAKTPDKAFFNFIVVSSL